MNGKNIKETPDTSGYYWAKINNAWQMVEVIHGDPKLTYRRFDGRFYYVENIKEWLGPLVPDNVTVFKSVPL